MGYFRQAGHNLFDVVPMGLNLDTNNVPGRQSGVAGEWQCHENREENEFPLHVASFLLTPQHQATGREGPFP